MLDMDMGQEAYKLRETGPGQYRRNAMPLIMVGNWGVTFEVTPRAGRAVLVRRRRPGERMSRGGRGGRDQMLIGAALLAVLAAFAAVLIVVLLARSVLGA